MAKRKITFEIEIPFDICNDKLKEWIEGELGINMIPEDNPMVNYNLSDVNPTNLTIKRYQFQPKNSKRRNRQAKTNQPV